MPAPNSRTQSNTRPAAIGDLLDAALELAASKWAVFPLAGKAPLTPHGFKDATADAALLRAWWARWPKANVGIAVPIGMVVVDVDPRDGGDDTIKQLEAKHGTLPTTLTVRTGSGGQHLWFKTSARDLLQSDLGHGVQTRVGGKGYVVAPPSIHPETRQPYEWIQPLSPVCPLPDWIGQKLRPKPVEPMVSLRVLAGGQPSGQSFLDWAFQRIRHARQGEGHDTLRNVAILAGGYVAAGRISESDARQTLRAAADSWERPYANAYRTIDDGLDYGRNVKGAVL